MKLFEQMLKLATANDRKSLVRDAIPRGAGCSTRRDKKRPTTYNEIQERKKGVKFKQRTRDATLLQKQRQHTVARVYRETFLRTVRTRREEHPFCVNVALEKPPCRTRRHSTTRDNDVGIHPTIRFSSCLLLSFSLFHGACLSFLPSCYHLYGASWLLRRRFPFLRWQWPSTVERK